jgi:S-formylglutathione hydrolase FrmB
VRASALSVAFVSIGILIATLGRGDAGEPQLLNITFQSTLLSQFLKQPVEIGASVLLPDTYYKQPTRRYPVIYVVPAFEGTDSLTLDGELDWQRPMRSLGTEFIVVFLQGMMNIDGEDVHTEFADSASNGPWGDALTSEFIPTTDAHLRTIPSGNARFLFGHSSGGWSVLWLQVNYPATFNGAWALSPDPVDFHDFFGPDITKPGQNFYHDAAGHAYGICRVGNHDSTTVQRLVSGPYGCGWTSEQPHGGEKPWGQRQMDTYDDVFSPALANGKPEPMLDRTTGAIDPSVASYWEEHYDMTHLLETRWSALGPQLKGKLHVFVGGRDTFHLEGSVALMRDALAKLGSDAEIEIVPGDDHWQIYGDHGGLVAYALREMSQRAQTAQLTAPR